MDPRKWLLDKRVVRRNLDRGVLTWDSYEEHLKELHDLDGNFELVDLHKKEEEQAEAEEGAEGSEQAPAEEIGAGS